MSEQSQDPVDAWFDHARELLQDTPAPEPPRWPSASRMPGRARVVLRGLSGWAHLLVVSLAVGTTLLGRIDPAWVTVVVFAALVSIGPRMLQHDRQALLAIDVAARLSAEAHQRAFDGRSWARSAWVLGLTCVAAAVAAGYTSSLFADSPTPYWRAAPLRWGAASALVGVLTVVAIHQWRCARSERRTANADAEALELSETADGRSWSSGSRAHVLVGLLCSSVAAAVALFTGPENLDDSPAQVMVIGDDAKAHAAWLHERFGLHSEGLTLEEAWSRADASFDGEREQLETLTHLADLEGAGFVLLDLDAFGLDPAERGDLELSRSTGATPTFASIATGDVTRVRYMGGWGAQERSRAWWIPLGNHPVALGGAEPWMSGDDARRLALARAFFGQPAFHFPDFEHPENSPEFNGRSHTLLRGIIHFGLDADFWSRALGTYTALEDAVSEHRIHPSLGG